MFPNDIEHGSDISTGTVNNHEYQIYRFPAANIIFFVSSAQQRIDFLYVFSIFFRWISKSWSIPYLYILIKFICFTSFCFRIRPVADRCYGIARMESFFATLKKKLYRINTTKMTVEQVKSEVFRSVCLKSRNLQNGMNHDTMAPKVLYTLAIQSARSMNYEAVCQS